MTLRRRPLLLAALAAFALPAAAQGFPDKPITFIVPFAAASATDQLARVLGQAVTEQTRQPVVIDNKPGANAFLGARRRTATPSSSRPTRRRPPTNTCSPSCPTTP